MSYRNLTLLFFCQLISATGSFSIVMLGGIIGSTLSTNASLATLPVSMMVVVVAATTVPATILMRRIGRKSGFALASVSAAAAVLLAAYALSVGSFLLFTAAAGLFGINMAFTQQYRYAAAESVEARFTGRAISLVLMGAIGGALLGPLLVTRGANWIASIPYGGTLLALAGLYLLQAVLFFLLGPLRGEESDAVSGAGRPLREIIRQPLFVVAVLGGVAAYGVMTLIMTATPLSMHVHDGYSLEVTSRIIRNHVLAMYLPSLVSGFLIERLGAARMMAAGALVLLGASVVALQGQAIVHYWISLVLLGVGWNFLYVGGTTLLTRTYSIEERFRAQAVNEFSVFGSSASASLLAGVVIHLYGWTTLVLLPLPLLIATLIGLHRVWRDPRAQRAVQQAV
ncbi:MAG: MFS transporter [Woeseia sp.]|nr:MFS transporter [Woeseia sp.]MBT8096969.1 MFS transporter [Woeseia sp.]NNE62222.1 MFS transporter [Woeseia sp.]NNL55912.1 MFS transporter [Woeseia sp.]